MWTAHQHGASRRSSSVKRWLAARHSPLALVAALRSPFETHSAVQGGVVAPAAAHGVASSLSAIKAQLPPQSAAPSAPAHVDRRLQRLQQARDDGGEKGGRRGVVAEVIEGDEEEEDDEEVDRRRARRRAVAEVMEGDEGDADDLAARQDQADRARAAAMAQEDEDDDEEAAERRRRMIREKLKMKQQAELLPEMPEDEEEEEEEEYEEEEEEEEEFNFRPLLKPVFVPKVARETVAERERLEKEEEEKAEEEKKKRDARKMESRAMVESEIRKDEALIARGPQTPPLASGDPEDREALPDDSDDVNEARTPRPRPAPFLRPAAAAGRYAAEYEAWKQRELARIKRDREDRQRYADEMADLERRRLMTDEEIKREDASVLARDYDEPTLEDHYNKEAMPKPMQVKNFGKAGRTKYTHLLDQDTTAGKDVLFFHNKDLKTKYESKMAGVGGVAERQAKKPKL
eukprot:tig00020539_g10434.t1